MELTISYSQLMLMNYDGEQPYVDWTDEDFERGYAKADGTVIFEALSDYTCEVKVTPGKHIEKEEVVRTVAVPFTVENECIVVTSILSNKFQILFQMVSIQLYYRQLLLKNQRMMNYIKYNTNSF